MDNTLDCHSRGSKIDPSSVFRMVQRTFCHAVLRDFSCLNLYMEKKNSGWFKQLLTKFKFRKNSRNLCISFSVVAFFMFTRNFKSRKENPQKLTQLSSRSHPRHLVGKRTAQKDTIIDITSDSQVNSNFPYRWSPASLTFNNYFYLFLYLYIT